MNKGHHIIGHNFLLNKAKDQIKVTEGQLTIIPKDAVFKNLYSHKRYIH